MQGSWTQETSIFICYFNTSVPRTVLDTEDFMFIYLNVI